MIRKSPPWMEQIDERILEFIDEYNNVSEEVVISSEGIRYPKEEIRNHLDILQRAELISEVETSIYSLSIYGEEFLEGERDMVKDLSEDGDQIKGDAVKGRIPEEVADYLRYMVYDQWNGRDT